ncbi:MAG: 3-phosphoshikimate 1-carboxyvinyltransferase [Candidatus Adiutrix sp.]|jgi:3-phosphoshikimate 1-carboxyvinyltransferase|nr:3-phosphoshikimate 1-carboxyvinyltransferase [Candidatus Adiutrix sp.]
MPLRGEFTPPGDKSISHRLILMSIAAEGEMTVTGLGDGDDVKTSLRLFRTLGGETRGSEARLTLAGLGGGVRTDPARPVELDCANSGTTARLLAGLATGLPGLYVFDGDAQLRRRPMERLAEPLRRMGGRVETTDGRLPMRVTGGLPLEGIKYVNRAASAQLKSAVILATLKAASPSLIIEPAPTRDHTERLVRAWGGHAVQGPEGLEVRPGRLVLPPEMTVPADPSSAAFFLTAAALEPGGRVTARSLLLSPARIGFLRVLERLGAEVSINRDQDQPEPAGRVTVAHKGPLRATEVTEIPSLVDEVPILALAAAFAEGTTVFRGLGELRHKETDRLAAIHCQLGALGVRARVEGDDLFITGPATLAPPEVLDSGRDHRLAMTLFLARHLAGSRAPVLGEESISISYPGFMADLARLAA